MCSHRSGESEDTTIADLAVGLCTGEIKRVHPVEVNVPSTISGRIEEEQDAAVIMKWIQKPVGCTFVRSLTSEFVADSIFREHKK